MIQILNTVLPVILVLAIGVMCRKKNLLTREGINALKNVAVNIALPAVMLNAFATMNYSVKNVLLAILMFAVCVGAFYLGKILSLIIKDNNRFIPFLTTGFEAGMLGYSLYPLMYGSENIGDFACIDLGQVLFVFTLYKILLGMDRKESTSTKQLFTEMMQSPTIIAICIGVLIGATGIYKMLEPSGISGLIDACTGFISAPTGAIILITIGYDLVFEDIPWKSVGKVVVLRIITMAVLRVIAGVIVGLIGYGNSLDSALNIMFILPAPFVLPVFADDENQRAYVSSSLSVMTLITIIGFIILVSLSAF